MKCPYRKKEAISWARKYDNYAPVKTEEFADCCGTECPFYKPEAKANGLTVPETCWRALVEMFNTPKARED